MDKFGTAQPAGRVEDRRFLTGQGRYVADILPQGRLWAAFLRADVAHAHIAALDLSPARDIPGVHAVLDAAALEAQGVTLGMSGSRVTNRDGTRGADPERPVLARGTVRHVGEAVAVVIADTLQAARDGVEAISVTYDDLPPALSLSPGGGTIHPQAPGNLAYDYALGDPAATERALTQATHRIAIEVIHNRVFAAPMENRAAFAEWDGARLHLCVNGQGVWTQKAELARMLHLAPDAVRVTNPDVGGGFGMKGMAYPEYVVIAAAARHLGRPVAWISDRGEAMQSDTGGRDLVALAELGFDADHRLTAYRCRVRCNLGAYNSQFGQSIQSALFAKVLTGPYDLQCASLEVQGLYTNTPPVDAYRGAGRPEAILTLERAMDAAARQMGVDPFDLRRRNLIRAFPYAMMNGEVIRDGDFPRVLDRLARECDWPGFAARQADSAARGMLRGFGLCQYIESILGDPVETARIAFGPQGRVQLYVGTQSNGQGHETVYARILSDRTGIPFDAIEVIQGDSDRIATGGGTGGSRSVTLQGAATLATVATMTDAFAAFLAGDLGPGVTFSDGTFGAPGTNRRLTLIEAADLARAQGRDDLLSHQATTRVAQRSFPNGAHAAEVEIDPETGALEVVRYTVTDDFGNLMAPQLVEGQVQGGIAQGWGQAVAEAVRFDETGQLLSGSFMDYAMPRATHMPMPRFTTESVPTATNPLGMKGCGEAGTVGSLAAISNAVADALAPAGVTRVDMPFSPARLWTWLQEAGLQEARAGG